MLPGLDDLSFKALHAWAEEHGDAALTDGAFAALEPDLVRHLGR